MGLTFRVQEQEKKLMIMLHMRGHGVAEIARQVNRSPSIVRKVLVCSGRQLQPITQEVPDPTPQEIEERIQEVQARWSNTTRKRRCRCRPIDWEVPTTKVMLEHKKAEAS